VQCYPVAASFLNSGLYRWGGDANTFAGDDTSCVEVVCSPNNPDGGIRHAVVKSKSSKAIYDFAYYWPQYTPITEAAAHDVMLFTFSKCSGHAGTRLGYFNINIPTPPPPPPPPKRFLHFMLKILHINHDIRHNFCIILTRCNVYNEIV
jgi:aspartate/methionine/tyrosine aminotransferase